MSKVLIVGGGAAGMMAAIFAAANGHEVHIYEKNEKFGKKLYITGKGRCNLTNDSDPEQMLSKVMRNSNFLYSAFYGFSSDMVMEFFERAGCHLKVERGNRVFPASNHASDIIFALSGRMRKLHIYQHLNTEVKSLLFDRKMAAGIVLKDGTKVKGDKVIVATGGMSYPSTGSTGDGYRFAKKAGHEIKQTIPSLVPFNMKETFVKDLQGLALRNVEMKIAADQRIIFQDFGELLFTHFGISGPLVLSGSSYVAEYLLELKDQELPEIKIMLDLKPALTIEQLDARILREFNAAKNKQFKNILGNLLPSKMHTVILDLCSFEGDIKINDITKTQRQEFVSLLKQFTITFDSLRDYQEAVITKGGISVKEINPSTMESKLCRNLYFAGEVLDLDALTGGYNLQIAWSTGFLAGNAV